MSMTVCRVHDLRSMRQVAFLEAHDAEVLCLEFTRPASGKMRIVVLVENRLWQNTAQLDLKQLCRVIVLQGVVVA